MRREKGVENPYNQSLVPQRTRLFLSACQILHIFEEEDDAQMEQEQQGERGTSASLDSTNAGTTS
jgi:hypothetical protein